MSVTPLYSKETKAQVRDGSCLPRRSMASLRLDKNTQVQEFYYLMGELEGNKGFSLPFSCMVLPLPALPDSDGWTRLGKHGEIRKTKHWPFPFIPQLWASPAFFGDSLRAESGTLKRRGQECGKWGKQHRLIPGDSGLTPWGWEPSPYLCGLPTKNAINYSQCENK